MKGKTKRAILDAALRLFCKDGVEAVGFRDICAVVGISPGNLTYYFPTKVDIIKALCDELIIEIDKEISLASSWEGDVLTRHYRLMEKVFYVQLRYRFIFEQRYAEIVTAIPTVQAYYQNVLKQRFIFWQQLSTSLVSAKLAIPELEKDTDALSYVFNILALFWHQEFRIYQPALDGREKVGKALAIFFQPYKPYLTKKGKAIYEQLVMRMEVY